MSRKLTIGSEDPTIQKTLANQSRATGPILEAPPPVEASGLGITQTIPTSGEGTIVVTTDKEVVINNYENITEQRYIVNDYTGISGFSGSTGPAGPTGPTGASGYSGMPGAASSSGYSGETGTSGYSGEMGTTGASGYSGEVGAPGVSGYSGEMGTTGASGYSGEMGTAGASGYSGEMGTAGASGYSGEVGAPGASGYSGEMGTAGASGYSGEVGAPGVSGYSGAGYFGIPQSGTAKTSSYSLQASDASKFIEVGSGGSITIPDTTFNTGDTVTIFNNTTGSITITCSITTAYIGGTDTDQSSVTLSTRGVANILFISGTVCVITGNVS